MNTTSTIGTFRELITESKFNKEVTAHIYAKKFQKFMEANPKPTGR